MDKDQINHKEMIDTTLSYLDMETAKWTAIPKIGQHKNSLANINLQIEQTHRDQLDSRVYVGKSKRQLKNVVAIKGDILNDLLEAHALEEGNAPLASKMRDSYSDLFRMRDTDFIPKLKDIIQETESNKEVLTTDFGVTDEQIEDIQLSMDQFLEINGLPAIYRVTSARATKDLKTLLREADKALELLDKVMTVFKRSDASFYNGYKSARVIIND